MSRDSEVARIADDVSRDKDAMCPGHCGSLGWTVERYGRVTHKHGCPRRPDPFCQTHGDGCPPTSRDSEVREAIEGLRPWLRHKVACNCKTDDPADTERCKCGLRAAILDAHSSEAAPLRGPFETDAEVLGDIDRIRRERFLAASEAAPTPVHDTDIDGNHWNGCRGCEPVSPEYGAAVIPGANPVSEPVSTEGETKPDHHWNDPDEDGHDCADCASDSMWKCDKAAHLPGHARGTSETCPACVKRYAADVIAPLPAASPSTEPREQQIERIAIRLNDARLKFFGSGTWMLDTGFAAALYDAGLRASTEPPRP